MPQMVNLDVLNGISFKKGCYTGQEIVARTHYLGKVKRRTHLAHLATDLTPQAGDDLFAESADAVGKIVRAAAAPQGGFDVLAELRLESAAAGAIHWKAPDGGVAGTTGIALRFVITHRSDGGNSERFSCSSRCGFYYWSSLSFGD